MACRMSHDMDTSDSPAIRSKDRQSSGSNVRVTRLLFRDMTTIRRVDGRRSSVSDEPIPYKICDAFGMTLCIT